MPQIYQINNIPSLSRSILLGMCSFSAFQFHFINAIFNVDVHLSDALIFQGVPEEKVLKTEETIIGAFISLIMRLSESLFRPMFLKVIDISSACLIQNTSYTS